MTRTKAKLWARLIHKGAKTIEDVEQADRGLVREVYLELFGIEL